MNEITVLASFSSLIVSGYFMLLTMTRHRQQIQSNGFSTITSTKKLYCRVLASFCLLLSMLPVGASYGWGIGSVYWFGLLNIVILILALLLNYAVFSIRWLFFMSLLVGLAAIVLSFQ